MVDKFPYGKRPSYPHMKPADVVIWEKFISEFPDMYDSVQYDLGLGSPPPFDPIVNATTGGDASELYKYKIDVVGFKGDQIDIIEIKPNAGPSSLGQVNAYRALYIRDLKPNITPKAVVITDQERTDMAHLASTAGVMLVVV